MPRLPYEYDALEPFIDAKTMEVHYTKHHQTYVNKLNEALEKAPEIADRPLDELLRHLDEVPEAVRAAVRNHGGGHLNHSFFWTIMKPPAGDVAPGGKVAEAIDASFGGLAPFKDAFSAAAAGVFGSGWAWLVIDASGRLAVTSTPNQDNPIMRGERPILGLDVWEHAYYLKHQSDRAGYIKDWWSVVNWQAVDEAFKGGSGGAIAA